MAGGASAVAAGRVQPVRWFAAVGLVCGLVYALAGSSALGEAAFLVVGVGGCVSMVAGPRLHRTRPDRPWRLIVAASAVFLVGALVRPWAAQQPGGLMALADAFTLPGYALLVAGIAALLRARNSVDGQAVLDGLIVGLGAGLLSVTVFSVPAVQVSDRPPLVSALAGVYPLLDVVLLLLLVNLAFTTAVRQVSFGLLAAGVVLLLVGDLGYAVIGARGELSGPTWLDLPFLGCYVLFGCAALHPSMVKLGRAVPRAVQAWSWRRLILIVPALVTPFVLVMLGSRTPAERIAIGAVGTAMMALLLLRAAAAVGAYARAEKVFRFQAIHDGLTGLPNRAAAVAAIGQLLAQQELGRRPLWVFLLNLDGFKAVNDSWGHDAGDRLLIDVGRRLRQATPAVGSVARLGGDEFVVAVPAWDHEAAVLGEQLMAVLAKPLQGGGLEIVVSASVGMARAEDGHTAEGLLLDADAAMYRAKAEGRHRRVVFDPSMRRHVRERSELEQSLRRAVTRGELRLAYQPIVRIDDGTLVGAEALLRWDHPDRGPIPPSTFVPVAEEAGLIGDIGEWALVEALTVTTAWRRAQLVAPDFWMSVNVSPRQLRDNRVLDTVRQALADTGLPSTALVLEITESVMLDESEATEGVLKQLRALGVRLVVDDFGTGFSALGYLRRHPVTGVKIDRSFVDGLGRDPEDEEIIRAVVAMSSALGLSIVAEGVETPLQREALLSLGVTLGQGWLWARAVTTAEFADRYGGGHPLPTGPSAAAPAAEVSATPAPAGGNS